MTMRGRKRILIIDDEKDFCFFVKANLEQLGGYEVIMAASGETGLAAAREVRPDLVLLDIMMPGLSGFDVLKRLKSDVATMGIPVLMLTARGDAASQQEAVRLYDDDYLVKPIQAEELKERIERVLARSRPGG